MKYSQLLLHETYKKFPLYNGYGKNPKSSLTVRNINLSQYPDKQSRKKVLLKQKKQLVPHCQSESKRIYHNDVKSLIKRTQKIISDKYKNNGNQKSYSLQTEHKFHKNRAMKGRALSKSLNWVDDSKKYNNQEQNKSVLQSSMKNDKLRQYLSSAINKTMLIKKVQQNNKQSPQILSVRLSRQKQYQSRKASTSHQKRNSRICNDRQQKPAVRYQGLQSYNKRASTSHNYRNLRVINRKSTQQIEPW